MSDEPQTDSDSDTSESSPFGASQPAPAAPQAPDSSLSSLAPGGQGGGWGSALANSFASMIGYGTGNRQLQADASRNMERDIQLRAAAPVQQGLATALDLAGKGDDAGAIAALKANPATLLSQTGMALYQRIVDRQRLVQQHTATVASLESSPDVIRNLAAQYMKADPLNISTKDALTFAFNVAKGSSRIEKGPDGFHVFDLNGVEDPSKFVPIERTEKLAPGETLAGYTAGKGGAPGTMRDIYRAPQSHYAKDESPDVRLNLPTSYDAARDQALKLRGQGMTEAADAADQAADAMLHKARLTTIASKNPEDVKRAVEQTHVDPIDAQNGTLSPADSKLVTDNMEARKNAAITLNASATVRAHMAIEQDPKTYVLKDGSGTLVQGSKLDMAKGVADGRLTQISDEARKRLETYKTVQPQLNEAKELVLQVYGEPGASGLTWQNAVNLYIQRHQLSGGEARSLQGVMTRLGVLLAQAESGTVRPGLQIQQHFLNDVLPGSGQEDVTSALAKLQSAEYLMDNRIDTLSGRTGRHTSTNGWSHPDIDRVKNGEKPIGVNPDGSLQFAEPVTVKSGRRY